MPSPKEIQEARTEAGGWTRKTLESWGVSWPPYKGWKKELEANWEFEQVLMRDKTA
jgi:hypothetical protein